MKLLERISPSVVLAFVALSLWAQPPEDGIFSLLPGDVVEASVGNLERSRLVVTLTPEKSAELASVTSRNLNKQVKMVVCGKLRSEPFIRERIAGPALEIFVSSNEDALATVKCLLTSTVGFDQLHKWTDANGEMHYSEKPPSPSAKPVPPVEGVRFDPNTFQPLRGSWQVTKATMNGRESGDPALLKGTWTFEGNALTMQSPQKGTAQFKLKIDATAEPKAIYLMPVQPIKGGTGWMLFARKGEILKLAYFDNLEGRPEGFKPREPGAKPELIVLMLSRRN